MSDINTPEGLRIFISDEVREHVRDQVNQIWSDLMVYTPVQTGQLRASWNVSEGAPDYSTVDSGGSISSPLPPPQQPRLALRDAFPEVFICNGKPYAGYVEDGTAKMGPRGMVARALANVK